MKRRATEQHHRRRRSVALADLTLTTAHYNKNQPPVVSCRQAAPKPLRLAVLLVVAGCVSPTRATDSGGGVALWLAGAPWLAFRDLLIPLETIRSKHLTERKYATGEGNEKYFVFLLLTYTHARTRATFALY